MYCKRNNCKGFIHFKIPRKAFDPFNGKCILSEEQKKCYSFTCKKRNAETSIDFNKIYNYHILKVINDVNW